MRQGVLDSATDRPAPALELPRSDGGTLSLGELRGQPVLLTFLSHAA